jgi:methyl-accepting chemotaxis protein
MAMGACTHLDNAIGAHGMWKMRLRKAIETGRTDVDPAKVAKDDQCDFGRWLYTEVDAREKASAHFRTIQALHAEFHRAAARVLELAVSRHVKEAVDAMSGDSAFARASGSLTTAMLAWRRELGAATPGAR